MTRNSDPTTIQGILDQLEGDPDARHCDYVTALGMLKREGHVIDGLPPLPEPRRHRFVFDTLTPQPPIFNSPGLANTRAFIRLAGDSEEYEIRFIRGIVSTKNHDPIPKRTELALHAALNCCDPYTGFCDGRQVRETWTDTKESES